MKLLYKRVQSRLTEFNSFLYKWKQTANPIQILKADQYSLQIPGLKEDWRDFQIGSNWPSFDSYYWIRPAIQIPRSLTGQAIELRVVLSKEYTLHTPEGLVFVNGEIRQGIDRNHANVLLTSNAQADEKIDVAIQVYTGKQFQFIKPEEIPPHQLVECAVAAPDENATAFYHQAKNFFEAAQTLPEDTRLRLEILSILGKSFERIDYTNLHRKEFNASVEDAMRYLTQKIRGLKAAPSREKVCCTGHAHIDVAWLWPLRRTRQKSIHTFSTVLELMSRYPNYHFIQSQPQLYQYIQEDCPPLFEKIKNAIEEGRWEADGGMWVEADCNVTSGESLIRQFLYGRRFFEEELNVSPSVLWLPDVFGYSWALPQIMRQCEIDYFMTTKISWNQYNQIPYDTFQWRGIDGTEVLTHFITTPCDKWFKTYNGALTPKEAAETWNAYQQKEINDEVLLSFGYGDGGGGPTEKMIQTAECLKNVPGYPQVKMGRVDKFFQRLEKKVKDKAPLWNGELYLEYHRGTYTTQAQNKKFNREAEFHMQRAETIAAIAALAGMEYPRERFQAIWERILLNQFHDIIPGSSIREVYEDSAKDYAWIEDETNRILSEAEQTITTSSEKEKEAATIVNTLGWKRTTPFLIPDPGLTEAMEVHIGEETAFAQPVETLEGERKLLIDNAELNPYSASVLEINSPFKTNNKSLRVTKHSLENSLLRIEFNDHGEIVSLYDKEIEREVLNPGEVANVFQAFEDKPLSNDAWDIDIFYQDKLLSTGSKASIKILEKGPLRVSLQIRKTILDGEIIQNISLCRHSRRVDFETRIEWTNKDVLLKAAFPVAIHAAAATYDIQFGSVERPTHWNTSWDWARFETCAQKWVDLSEGDYGVSLLNNCKYGHDIHDHTIRLTLIKCPDAPDPDADVGTHLFTYSLFPHPGDWRAARIPQEAYELNTAPLVLQGRFSHPHLETGASFVSVDQENIILETIKYAEKEDAVILRLYENRNQRGPVTLNFGIKPKKVEECNLLERRGKKIKLNGDTIDFYIKPYELRTFKVWF